MSGSGSRIDGFDNGADVMDAKYFHEGFDPRLIQGWLKHIQTVIDHEDRILGMPNLEGLPVIHADFERLK
jgi:hypothetical protein